MRNKLRRSRYIDVILSLAAVGKPLVTLNLQEG